MAGKIHPAVENADHPDCIRASPVDDDMWFHRQDSHPGLDVVDRPPEFGKAEKPLHCRLQ